VAFQYFHASPPNTKFYRGALSPFLEKAQKSAFSSFLLSEIDAVGLEHSVIILQPVV
jgi:hypothetical protein